MTKAPIPHGGTRPKPPQELRSPVLRRHGQSAADSSFRRIEETWPELAEIYGERGRSFTAEDNLWHMNFLDAAIAVGFPDHFDRYADWLVSFLVPRGLRPEHVAGAFGFLADAIEEAEVEPQEREHRRQLVEVLRSTAARVEYDDARARPEAPALSPPSPEPG